MVEPLPLDLSDSPVAVDATDSKDGLILNDFSGLRCTLYLGGLLVLDSLGNGRVMGLLSRCRLRCELRVLDLWLVDVDSMFSDMRPSRGKNRPRLLVEPRSLSDCPRDTWLRFDALFDRRRRGGDSSTSLHSDEDVLPCSLLSVLLLGRRCRTLASGTSIGLDTTSLGAARTDDSGYGEHMADISLLQYVLHEASPSRPRGTKRDSNSPYRQR